MQLKTKDNKLIISIQNINRTTVKQVYTKKQLNGLISVLKKEHKKLD